MHRALIFFALLQFTLASCQPTKEVDFKDLVKRDDVFYPVNSATPFTGVMIQKADNGQYTMKAELMNGLPDGLYQEWFPNGQVKRAGKYITAKPEGKWIEYYQSGQLKSESNYRNGKKVGRNIEYFTDGTTQHEENRTEYGVRDGVYYDAYDHTKPSKAGVYKDSRFDGITYQYYDNGNLKLKTPLVNDRKQGVEEAFYYDGGKSGICEYSAGFKQGKSSLYYRNGRSAGEFTWVNDLKEGFALAFNEVGDTTMTGNYSGGNQEGVFTYYDTFGPNHIRQKTKEENYAGGILNGKVTEWFFRSGNIPELLRYRETSYKDGIVTGCTERVQRASSNGWVWQVSYCKEGPVR